MSKKIIVLVFAVLFPAVIFAGNNLRVGSYNLRMQQLDKGENDWSVRRARVMQSIRENGFDIFGVQELTDFAQDHLREDLGDTYEFVFFSPYSQDGKGTKAHGIAWRKDKIKLLECHRFWLSENPDSCSYNDFWQRDGKISKFKRGATCCLFETKSGKKFIFMCTHAALSPEDNAKYAHVLIDREKMYNPKGYPSFLVGDMNVREDAPSSELWRTYWDDAALCVEEKPAGTFNGFRLRSDEERPRIDFIYCRGKVRIKDYFCNTKLYDGLFASDHYPIGADVVIR